MTFTIPNRTDTDPHPALHRSLHDPGHTFPLRRSLSVTSRRFSMSLVKFTMGPIRQVISWSVVFRIERPGFTDVSLVACAAGGVSLLSPCQLERIARLRRGIDLLRMFCSFVFVPFVENQHFAIENPSFSRKGSDALITGGRGTIEASPVLCTKIIDFSLSGRKLYI